MASSVSYDFRPELRRPVLIEGLPGVGNVGKLAADLVARQLGARRYARMYSEELPPQVIVDGDCVADAARMELWVADIGDRDAVFVLGEFQGTTPNGQHILSEDVFRMVLPYDPSMVITLGGYGTGQLSAAPRVLGAVSDPSMRPRMEAAGIGFYPGEPQGGIVGAAAMMLAFGAMYGVPSVCIMGETSGYIVDHRSARNVIRSLCAVLGVEVDTSEYAEAADSIETASLAPADEAEPQATEEDISYIR